MRHASLDSPIASRVTVRGPATPARTTVLTPGALAFLARLHGRFADAVEALSRAREHRHAAWRFGERPTFEPETRAVRDGEWRVAPPPADLLQRTVEITGPPDRKIIINALNSGADVFMADFGDATSPAWRNILAGHKNLMDAVRGTITFRDPKTGQEYALELDTATLMVRPRGLHLAESHVQFDGRDMPAALFDVGLFLFHNAAVLTNGGSAPYFYLPKIEHYKEARFWNDVFGYAQDALGLPHGTIRATVLIETLPAAFQMEEILYELKEHATGLNCGRWDYVFSLIKVLQSDPDAVLPDRSQISMEQPCMRAYAQLAVKTCHRRGAHAIGGMSAFIPVANNERANAAALAQVRADKAREVADGFDGTWVAHPALVPIARDMFDERMPGPNQLDRRREDVTVTEADLLRIPAGSRTEAGLRLNIRVGIRYLEAWLQGVGCVPLYGLMEDTATAEVSRAQLWQWVKHRAALTDGRVLTPALLEAVVDDELRAVAREVGAVRFGDGRFAEARDLFLSLSLSRDLPEFLTCAAYALIDSSWD